MHKQAVQYIVAKSKNDYLMAKEIIQEYAAWLDFDLSFQNFGSEINKLEKMYTEPDGALLLAMLDNEIAGVIGIRKFEDKVCELKRMFVREAYRNKGIGRKLIEYAIYLSKKLNYNCIKLDTDASMNVAIKLYLDFGFMEIPAYRYNPNESARYRENAFKK
jgi:carbonic anhydrase